MFFALLPQDLLATSLQAFLSAPSFWVGSICLVSPPLQSRTQVPVSCLRSYCQPFGTPSQGKALHSSGSRLWFFLSPFICFPLPLFISFHQSLGYLSFYPSFLSSLNEHPLELFISSCNPSGLPPFHSPSLCLSLLYSHSRFPLLIPLSLPVLFLSLTSLIISHTLPLNFYVL